MQNSFIKNSEWLLNIKNENLYALILISSAKINFYWKKKKISWLQKVKKTKKKRIIFPESILRKIYKMHKCTHKNNAANVILKVKQNSNCKRR